MTLEDRGSRLQRRVGSLERHEIHPPALIKLDVVIEVELVRSRQTREPQHVVCVGSACTEDVDE
jgi:hypothetical protein